MSTGARPPDDADLAPDHPIPVALALGSNLGDRVDRLRAGVAALLRVVEVEAVSSVYETEPVGPAQPDFLNAAVIGTTRLAPRELLRTALAAESCAGRRRTQGDGPRTLDVDLVLYGARTVCAADLVVPHPRWRERGFVLAPLREIAPDWRDPETGLAVRVLAANAERMAGRPRVVAGPDAIHPVGGAGHERKSSVLGALLAGLLAFSLACTQQLGEVPGAALVVSEDPELRRVAAELLPELATRSGLELKAPVRVARRSRLELMRYLEAQLDEEFPPDEAAAIAQSYGLLGLIPEETDLRELMLSVYTEQVSGFYDPDSTALFVMDDQPAEDLRTVLIHELVHAVQDQAANLDSLTSRERGNDRQTAALAAIEGHATLVMFEYVTSQLRGGPVDLSEIPDFAARIRPALEAMRAQYPALAEAPLVIQEAALFPYLEGTAFVQRLWQDMGGRPSPLGDLLPHSTEQVTGGGPLTPGGRDEPVELRLAAELPVRYTNTLGSMETAVLLQELVDADAVGAARGWDGDRYALVDTPTGPALAWWTVWDDAFARDRFMATLRPALGRLPRPAEVVAGEVDGRPAALLEIGRPGEVTALLAGPEGP